MRSIGKSGFRFSKSKSGFPNRTHPKTWNFQKLLSYTFYGGNVVRVLVHFFTLPVIFTLRWWPLACLILSPPLQSFHVVIPTKKCLLSLFFYLSLQISLQISSLSFAGLPPTFSFSLSFSCSIFQFCGHDNLSKLNNLDNTDTETISAFVFIDSLVVSASQDAGGCAISRQNNLELHLGCHTC